MSAGMIPRFVLPGEIMPGQVGPRICVLPLLTEYE